jgi:hypothetical protein
MPTDHRLRLNDHQRLCPARPDGAKDNPQQPVWIPESGSLGVPAQHEKPVPQSQVLQHELVARKQACRKASQYGNGHFKHDPSNLPEPPVGSTISIKHEVFATHRCLDHSRWREKPAGRWSRQP